MKNTNHLWWQRHFNENYLKTYVDIVTPALTEKQVKFLERVLPLKKNSKILDLACGYGRHAIPLAEKGFEVTGFDYSKKFIALAKQKAKELKLKNVVFVRGDMRHLPYQNKFDAVINMFTAFGYFKNETDDLQVLKNICRALKPGGRFLIDLNNEAPSVVAVISKGKFNTRTGFWTLLKKAKQSNGLVVITKHEVDLLNKRWYMSRSWRERGKKKSYRTSVRMYSYPELKFLLELAGFKAEKVWGGFDGKPLSLKSRRMIILARR